MTRDTIHDIPYDITSHPIKGAPPVPITIERMQALIIAAKAHEKCLTELHKTITHYAKTEPDPAVALRAIVTMAGLNQPSVQAITVLMKEAQYLQTYERQIRTNTLAKRRSRARAKLNSLNYHRLTEAEQSDIRLAHQIEETPDPTQEELEKAMAELGHQVPADTTPKEPQATEYASGRRALNLDQSVGNDLTPLRAGLGLRMLKD